MGNSFAKDINKVFGHAGQGGAVAGGSPEDWPGSDQAGGGGAGTDNRIPDDTGQKPPPAQAPPINLPLPPPPPAKETQYTLQGDIQNPFDTAIGQRFYSQGSGRF